MVARPRLNVVLHVQIDFRDMCIFDVMSMKVEKLKSHKSPGIDQIPAELIKAGGRTFRRAIHKLIISICNKEELPEEWKESIIVPI